MIYLGREIYEGAVAFLIGREIGHHYLGHIEELFQKKYVSKIKKEELDADEFGTIFAMEYVKAFIARENPFDFITDDVYRKSDYRLLGILIVFQLICWLTGNKVAPIHPAAKTRFDRCLKIMEYNGVGMVNNTLQYELSILVHTMLDTRFVISRYSF